MLRGAVPGGGCRVRRTPSQQADQVGSVEWGAFFNNEISTIEQVATSAPDDDQCVTWLKLSPLMYSKLRNSYAFQEHDPDTEGYVMMNLPQSNKQLFAEADNKPSSTTTVRPTHPAFDFGSTKTPPDASKSAAAVSDVNSVPVMQPCKSDVLQHPTSGSKLSSSVPAATPSSSTSPPTGTADLSSQLSALLATRRDTFMTEDEYVRRRNDILSNYVTF